MLEQKVTIFLRSGSDLRTTSGSVQIMTWNKRERTARALRVLLGCWAAALVSVLFPLIHFVLVPSFLIAGPLVAFFVIGQESVICGGSGTCPGCGGALPIERSRNRFPLSELCTQCQSQLRIELAAPATPGESGSR